jgi:G:T-mismatch repair DNA endonuclease (very short patch repair protein)
MIIVHFVVDYHPLRKRDRANSAKLKKAGWRVIRVWEHQLKRTDLLVKEIKALLHETS